METHLRTILKTITWRIIAIIVVIAGVLYYSGGDWDLALKSGIVAGLVKTVLYYIHERLWNKSNIGRLHPVTKKPLK